jgi:tRNA/rRNA methyltransferase
MQNIIFYPGFISFLMPDITVVLVEPKFEGNIGAVARAMKNFGLDVLRLVKACEIEDEAYKRAKHARDVLEKAKRFEDLEDALKDCSLVAGTSSIETPSEKYFLRIATSPKEFCNKIVEHEGRMAILFGREDYGLYNEELKKCDILVKIAASEIYPIMNISHAASIIFYELYQTKAEKKLVREVTDLEKEKLYEYFHELLVATRHPKHKMDRTEVMFRRLVGRAVLTEWEYHILMGVFRDTIELVEKKE